MTEKYHIWKSNRENGRKPEELCRAVNFPPAVTVFITWAFILLIPLSLIWPDLNWPHFVWTESQPLRTGSRTVKRRPSSPWLRPITAQSVRTKRVQSVSGRMGWAEMSDHMNVPSAAAERGEMRAFGVGKIDVSLWHGDRGDRRQFRRHVRPCRCHSACSIAIYHQSIPLTSPRSPNCLRPRRCADLNRKRRWNDCQKEDVCTRTYWKIVWSGQKTVHLFSSSGKLARMFRLRQFSPGGLTWRQTRNDRIAISQFRFQQISLYQV